ncbi:MAG: tRNA pseudouridine(38-40) synthase TruA [Muribaculaceae bacterium]|nr:tRNA pseudouridine(38-40) synthase TruA [Muribaculaceae bacterium]
MSRYFIRLSYRGAPYHGWQVQPNAVSVQEEVENAFSTVLRVPVSIVGAGRTDTGVNARCMYAHFDYEGVFPEKNRLMISLNRLVGRDIAIHEVFQVADDAHARFDATERTYKYYVAFEKTPFFYPLSWYCPHGLDLSKMNEASKILVDTKDFTSFAKLHSDAKTNICNVTHAEWTMEGDSMAVFTISADRFLRNMVRAIVGTLVDVGRGKVSLNDFKKIIQEKDRCSAGQSMPGEALFLWDIKYPTSILKDKG